VLPPSNLAHGPVRQLTARSSRTDTAEPAAHNLAMPAAPASSGTAIPFRILGPLAVSRDGTEVTIAGGRQRALLTYLLLHANRVVRTDRLIDELFGDEPPESALNSVHAGISRLRRQLRGSGGGEVPIVTRPPGYVLELEREQLDLHVFKDLLEAGRRQLDAGKPEDARRTLADALELWRGEPLADLSAYAFAREEAARLEDLHLAVVMERIEADLARGRHTEVIGELERLVALHPLQERLVAQLMLALYRSGRQADALQVYQDARRTLVSELGLEPGKALQRLEQQILTQNPELDAPPRDATRRGREAGSRTRGRLPFLAAACVALVAAGALAAVLVTSGGEGLSSIAPNSVGMIDPDTNKLVAEIPTGETPKGLVAGGDAVWVVNSGEASVTRIDPARRAVLRTIAIPGRPSDAVAYGGSIWVLHNRGGGLPVDPYAGAVSVSEIDPNFDSVTRTIDVPEGFANTFEDPIAAGSGAIWVGGVTGVSRIDAKRGTVAPRLQMHTVADLVVRSGTAWAARTDGTLAGIDAHSDTVLDTISISAASTPAAVAATGKTLWVAVQPVAGPGPQFSEVSGEGALFRVDARDKEVVSILRVGKHPVAVASGRNAVWVADAEGREVLRIDPTTNDVVARIPVGARPTSIAVGVDSVWVTVT
jgi:DNA-binding SARP family transcriptional activator